MYLYNAKYILKYNIKIKPCHPSTQFTKDFSKCSPNVTCCCLEYNLGVIVTDHQKQILCQVLLVFGICRHVNDILVIFKRFLVAYFDSVIWGVLN